MRGAMRQMSMALIGLCLIMLTVVSCKTGKTATIQPQTKILIGERNKGWLRYEVYLLPADVPPGKHSSENMMLSIRVVNTYDNTSPLRKLSTSLDDYNQYYEYLLNHTKDDITMYANGALLYPVAYSFENNYNAFPFETINVGYKLSTRGKSAVKGLRLTYDDKVFARDTVNFYLNHIK